MQEYVKDVAFSKTSSIPNSYLFQPESYQRSWLAKRGKLGQDFNNRTLKRMKHFFKSLDTSGTGYVDKTQISEVLISLGLCKNAEDVQE